MSSREDTLIKVKALKGREYGKGVTRFSHEEILRPEVVATAWNLFDRMISKQNTEGLKQDRLGVILVTCLLLAIKMKCRAFCEGEIADNLAKDLCTIVGRENTCTPQQVSDMEKEMLKTLDWKVNAPTMQDFARLYVDLHPLGKLGARNDTFAAKYLHEMMKHQVEQALYKQELMMNYKPSVIAFAAMVRVEEQLDNIVLPTNEREFETLLLHRELKMEPPETEECLFVLKNYTGNTTTYAEYEAEIRNNAAAANNVQEDNHRIDSVASDDRQAESIRGGNDHTVHRSASSNRHESSRSLEDEDKRRGRSRKERRRQKKRKRSKSSKRRSASHSSTSSSSSSRSRSRSRKRKRHTDKRSKKKNKRRHRSKKCDASSTSSSSSSYDRDRKRRKKEKKRHKADDERSNDRTKSDAISKQSEQINNDTSLQADPSKEKAPPDASTANTTNTSKPPPSASAQSKSKAPMTQQQYLELQSKVREVVDPQTGRTRLVRGTGEIIERIVSRDQHSRLNKSATLGDGSGYAQDIMKAAMRK